MATNHKVKKVTEIDHSMLCHTHGRFHADASVLGRDFSPSILVRVSEIARLACSMKLRASLNLMVSAVSSCLTDLRRSEILDSTSSK